MRFIREKKSIADGILAGSVLLCFLSAPMADSAAGGFLFHMSLAALVAGLADWFAVTALFDRPLGIRFHTEMVSRSREKIVAAARDMVTRELLTIPRIYRLFKEHSPVEAVLAWAESHEEKLKKLLSGFLLVLVETESFKKLIREGEQEAGEMVQTMDLDFLAQTAAFYFLEQEECFSVLSEAVSAARESAEGEAGKRLFHDVYREALASYASRGMMNRMLARQVEGIGEDRIRNRLMKKIADRWFSLEDKNSPLYRRIRDSLYPCLQNLLARPAVRDWASQHMSRLIRSYIGREGNTGEWAEKAASQFLSHFLKEGQAHSREWSRAALYWISGKLPSMNQFLGKAVENKLNQYSGEDMARILKEHTGDDLAMIRVNGSCIGAILGSVFYIILHLAEGGGWL
jgi:uncharacterized membrane-anchored protein YjiN (DUF445 family)